MNGKMFIVTHKKVAMPKIKDYEPILVGADIHPEIIEYQTVDNQGINISRKNPNYCELTGIYWLWKNAYFDIIGISHYRRYFTKSCISNSARFYLTMEEAAFVLQNKRVILPKVRYSPTSIICAIKRAPNLDDVNEMYQAIVACFPQYIDDYMWYLRQNKEHLYNMFVMKWDDFCKYCDWLFTILDYIEERHDMDAEIDSYRLRLYGFLSERLISVWVHHNINDSEIAHISVINTEEGELNRFKHYLSNCWRNLLYYFNKLSKRNIDHEDEIIQKIIEKRVIL